VAYWLGYNFSSVVSDQKTIWFRFQLIASIAKYNTELQHLAYIQDNQEDFLISKETVGLINKWSDDV
jgi:hypothetical protein